MSLPSASLLPPAGTPVFLAAGHSIEEDSVYAVVQPTSGHARQRRRWTVQERVVSVSWLLRTAQLAAVDTWLDETLLACTLEFPARVANQGSGDALLWWRARWVAWPQTDMIAGGFGRVSGSLYLVGEGTDVGPV